MEICEDIRQTLGMKELYAKRKETIERLFGSAKENHGFRYTQMYGKARMEMKVGLTYACMNLKKLAKIKAKRGLPEEREPFRISVLDAIYFIKEKWLWYTHQSRFAYSLRTCLTAGAFFRCRKKSVADILPITCAAFRF